MLVIGGGISAAQSALAAVRAGHQVVLRSRRPLQTRPFDIDHGWLDMRKADRMRFEFLCLPLNRRRNAVREAQSGGSVPANYMKELHRLSEASFALTLEVDDTIDCSQVCVDGDGKHVVVNGETFAMVILATGAVTAPSCGDSSSLYHSVKELLKAPTVDGLPRVDSRLRWVPHEDIFVLGANAVLELGPGGGNLMGAMRGARVVANELHGLVGQRPGHKARPAHQSFSNQYVLVGSSMIVACSWSRAICSTCAVMSRCSLLPAARPRPASAQLRVSGPATPAPLAPLKSGENLSRASVRISINRFPRQNRILC